MKYKKILALAGAAMVMSAVTGCSSQKEEEPETLVISDMEVMSEDSTGSELSETETGAQELELDLSAETQTEPAPPETFTEPESETQTEAQTESQTSVTVQKPGEEETEEETTAGSDTETETGDKNSSSPAGRKDKKPSKPKKKPESERETQVSSETQKVSESQTQSETQKVSESQEQSETQKVTQEQSEPQAQTATEAESETQPETQTETEAESETQPETQTETEAESETQPETQTETEAESETQAKTETELESETQAQTETEPESETEVKAQSEAQDEFTQELKYVNDRVNVRKAASEQADIQALLTPGMHVLALSEQTGWIHVRYETDEGFAEGYIKAEYLSDASAVCTVKETINIRAEASMDSEKIGKFAAGETVIVISEKNGWSEIRYTQANESVNAYVKSEFLESIGAEDMSAKERLINGEAQSESELESEMQTETQSESETESEMQSETQSEAQPESEQPESEESESEQLASEEDVKWENAVQAQFELAKEFSPQMQSVGIIYSETNQDAKAQIQEYTQLASEYGIGLVTDTIEAEVDIDLIVSEMAGNVDAIFCMEDEMVTGLIQTVRAYADEVGIPVLGMDSAQVEQGCVAAYEDGILYWNAEEADKLGLTYDGLPVDEVKEY
ncbi:MAG: ABC transporter substrate binding protein [Lachnospiraceae bacterium]